MRPYFLFTMLLITTGIAASAQQQEPIMTRSQFTPFKKIPPVNLSVGPTSDTATINRSLNNPDIKDWYHEGTMVAANNLGKVYRMPVDNMPCLVTDATRTARMPVKKTQIPEQMPNAFSRSRMNRDSNTK